MSNTISLKWFPTFWSDGNYIQLGAYEGDDRVFLTKAHKVSVSAEASCLAEIKRWRDGHHPETPLLFAQNHGPLKFNEAGTEITGMGL